MSHPDRPLPSLLATAIGTALIAGILGFFLGQGSALGIFGGADASRQSQASRKARVSDSEESEDEDDGPIEGLNDYEDKNEECKLVLVVRTDLGMTKGKPTNVLNL